MHGTCCGLTRVCRLLWPDWILKGLLLRPPGTGTQWPDAALCWQLPAGAQHHVLIQDPEQRRQPAYAA